MITAPAPPRHIRTRYQRMAAAVQIAQRLYETARTQDVREGALGIVTLLAAPIERVRCLESQLARLAGPEPRPAALEDSRSSRAGQKSTPKDSKT